jgi:tyrosine-protein kinase Etk/Wzc
LQENKHNTSESNNKQSFSLIDIIVVFLKNKKKIFLLTGVICVLSIIFYFFVFDLIFLSTATIKSSNTKSGILGMLDAGLPDISGLDDIGIGGGKSTKELASYEEILKSRKCLEALINKYDLMNRDEYKFMEDAVKDFRENRLEINIDKLSGVMNVGVYDKDPVLAKEMVDYLLDELNKINIELNVIQAKNNREFIEQRYLLAKKDLASAEDTLKSFQLIYGIAPDLQIKASAQSVFTLEAELKAEEVKLDVIKKILSADQPEVKLQDAKVNSLRSKISEIETSTDLNDFLRLGNSPQIALSFLRLQRDLEIQSKILTFILPLYEQAKIEEKRETPTILILDKPYVAERKKKPKRLTMVVVWTFFGFIGLNILFLVKGRFNDYRNEIKSKVNSYKD